MCGGDVAFLSSYFDRLIFLRRLRLATAGVVLRGNTAAKYFSIGAKRSVLWPSKYDKMHFRPRTPLGELTTLPQTPIVGWGGDTPPHTPSHSAPRFSRLRRVPLGALVWERRQIFFSRTAPWQQVDKTFLVFLSCV